IHNLQKAIVGGRLSVSQLLIQTKWVAARVNLEDVERWADLELEGYAEDAELPNYRKVFTDRLEIYNVHREHWQSAGTLHYALNAPQPIAEIESFSREEHVSFPVSKNFPSRTILEIPSVRIGPSALSFSARNTRKSLKRWPSDGQTNSRNG